MDVDELLKMLTGDLEQSATSFVTAHEFEKHGPQRMIVSLEEDGTHADMPSSTSTIPLLVATLFDEMFSADLTRVDKARIISLMSDAVHRYMDGETRRLVKDDD